MFRLFTHIVKFKIDNILQHVDLPDSAEEYSGDIIMFFVQIQSLNNNIYNEYYTKTNMRKNTLSFEITNSKSQSITQRVSYYICLLFI